MIIPIESPVNSSDVPPMLMNGSGCPVTGNRPTATPMFTIACITRLKARPMASSPPNDCGARSIIRVALYSRIRYNANTKIPPINPYSSKTIA